MRHPQLSLLLLLLPLAACAHSQTFPVFPQGTYRYAGAVGGRPIRGEVELADYAVIRTVSGQCQMLESLEDLYMQRSKGRSLPVGCEERIVLEWDSYGTVRPIAHVSADRVVEEVQRGECLVWNTVQGRRTTCAHYDMKVVKRTLTERGTVTIERVQ